VSKSSGVAVAAGAPWPRRRRRLTVGRLARGSVPYALIIPVIAAIGAVLGYPLYSLVRLSFQHYGLFELIKHKGQSVGFRNFSSILHDAIFWHTLVRTIVFTAVNVALTMAIGTALALLFVRLSSWARILLTSGLVLVWATPAVVAVQIWIWMTNYQNGIVNYVLTQLHIGNYSQHDWLATTFSQLGLATTLIVWGAVPFVAISVYAALAQVPGDLAEAAEIDGAKPWRVFVDVTLPILRPVLLILTSLSIIWDFGVFTQPYLLIGQGHIHPGNYLMGIYLFEEGYVKTDFGRGAAISLLMLAMVALLSIVYVRKMVALGDEE
jgi:N,N'-diacetylchitobiose transport system permease protein